MLTHLVFDLLVEVTVEVHIRLQIPLGYHEESGAFQERTGWKLFDIKVCWLGVRSRTFTLFEASGLLANEPLDEIFREAVSIQAVIVIDEVHVSCFASFVPLVFVVVLFELNAPVIDVTVLCVYLDTFNHRCSGNCLVLGLVIPVSLLNCLILFSHRKLELGVMKEPGIALDFIFGLFLIQLSIRSVAMHVEEDSFDISIIWFLIWAWEPLSHSSSCFR